MNDLNKLWSFAKLIGCLIRFANDDAKYNTLYVPSHFDPYDPDTAEGVALRQYYFQLCLTVYRSHGQLHTDLTSDIMVGHTGKVKAMWITINFRSDQIDRVTHAVRLYALLQNRYSDELFDYGVRDRIGLREIRAIAIFLHNMDVERHALIGTQPDPVVAKLIEDVDGDDVSEDGESEEQMLNHIFAERYGDEETIEVRRDCAGDNIAETIKFPERQW